GGEDKLRCNDIRVIFEDSKQNIWVGTNGYGLNLLNTKTGGFKSWRPDNSGITSNDVRSIVEAGGGNLWLGTYGGGVVYFNVARNSFYQLFDKPAESNLLVN